MHDLQSDSKQPNRGHFPIWRPDVGRLQGRYRQVMLVITLLQHSLYIYRCSRDLDTFSKLHFEECYNVDPDVNRGELSVVIPKEARERGFVAEGKPLKVGIEFSFENPVGGIHFVVPNCNENNDSKKGQAVVKTMAERAAHMFTCSHENSSR